MSVGYDKVLLSAQGALERGEDMNPQEIYNAASAAALKAWNDVAPVPMTVVGGGQKWVIMDGACGFAWVNISPARGKMVSWLRENAIGRKAYKGGWDVSSWQFGNVGRGSQSYQRAYAAAAAAAGVLQEHGITAYPEGRLD